MPGRDRQVALEDVRSLFVASDPGGGRDSARPFADAQLRLCGQHELRIDQNVALGDLAVRIADKLNVPLRRRVCNCDFRPAAESPA